MTTVKITEATTKSIRSAVLRHLKVEQTQEMRARLMKPSSVPTEEMANDLGISVDNAQQLRWLMSDLSMGHVALGSRQAWVNIFTYLEIRAEEAELQGLKQQAEGLSSLVGKVVKLAFKPEFVDPMLDHISDSGLRVYSKKFWEGAVQIAQGETPEVQTQEAAPTQEKEPSVRDRVLAATGTADAKSLRQWLLARDPENQEWQVTVKGLNFRPKGNGWAEVETYLIEAAKESNVELLAELQPTPVEQAQAVTV